MQLNRSLIFQINSLTRKYQTRVEVFNCIKHTSLLRQKYKIRKFNVYKMDYKCQYYKTFNGGNLYTSGQCYENFLTLLRRYRRNLSRNHREIRNQLRKLHLKKLYCIGHIMVSQCICPFYLLLLQSNIYGAYPSGTNCKLLALSQTLGQGESGLQ